jgi:hypothetical protein
MKKSQVVAIGVVVLGIGAVSSGCGAAPARGPEYAPVAPAVSEPPMEESVERKAFDSSVVAAPPPPPAAAPAPVTVAVPSAARGGSGGAGFARSELDLAEAQLKSSAGDCATACRALGSMERATAHLCALAGTGDDQRSCQDARSKVLAGRDKVRSSCGDCPGGPSLDRNAPIPSTR